MPSWSEVMKKIKKAGCTFKRQGEGSAEMWVNQEGEDFPLHPHGSKEVKSGMYHAIKKWANLK